MKVYIFILSLFKNKEKYFVEKILFVWSKNLLPYSRKMILKYKKILILKDVVKLIQAIVN